MSIVIFERQCPKCKPGVMVYRSNTIYTLGTKLFSQYSFFMCTHCTHQDNIESNDSFVFDEIHFE